MGLNVLTETSGWQVRDRRAVSYSRALMRSHVKFLSHKGLSNPWLRQPEVSHALDSRVVHRVRSLHAVLTMDLYDYNYRSLTDRMSYGAVWKSRWPSWAPVPNKPKVSEDVKQHSTNQLHRSGHSRGRRFGLTSWLWFVDTVLWLCPSQLMKH